MIGLSRTQLTTLAVVSRNDYDKNIYSLGPVTNFSVVKTLQGNGVHDMVSAYLSHPQVISKNKLDETFASSLRVFVDLEQTPIDLDGESSVLPRVTFADLQERFRNVCAMHALLKANRKTQA
ncbi:hypothetical protein BGX23_005752, partial [Mortierella sp. AD031]